VDLYDFVILKQNFGVGSTWAQGDFDGNGSVTLVDFIILKNNFATGGPLPEPATIVMVGLAACLLRPRR